MYEACYIQAYGFKNGECLTFISHIKIRLHKSNLYFFINQLDFNKTKFSIIEQERISTYSPALIKFTGDSSYPYKIKYKGKIYILHKTGRCQELWNDYPHT